MSRTISSTIQTEIAKAKAIPRTLYHLELQDKSTGAINHLYLTNHEVNIAFGGITYQSYQIRNSNIKTYLKNQTDNCNLTIDNTDKGMSAYFASNEFSGQNAEVWKIFLDAATLLPIGTYAGGDYIIQFKGMMDRPRVNEERIDVRIVNVFNREQSYTPWRSFGAKCNWRFCGTECGYNSASQPRGAADSGSTTTLTDTVLVGISSMVGGNLKMLTGSNKNEVRKISAHNTTTGQVSVPAGQAFPYAIAAGDSYIIECDKSKSTCKGFSNEANFGGFDEYATFWMRHPSNANYDARRSAQIGSEGGYVPVVYGSGSLQGVYFDEDIDGVLTNLTGYRIYGVSEGEISSIEKCLVNGNEIAAFTLYPGTSSQSFVWRGETKNYKNTAVVTIALPYFTQYGPIVWSTASLGSGYSYDHDNFFSQHATDSVIFTVKGLKVQKYLANGTADGSPVWSNNPVWCLLDFVMNRASKKLDPSLINFAYAKASADLCDTLGYTLNLVIKEQRKDNEIISTMLATCRGYITYSTGKMEINLERAWVGAVAHSFDDASSGKTADNISEGSFTYFQDDVNDTPNRVIVKYVDQEIRENMALVNGYLPAANTTIPYSDLQGSFAASGTIYIGGQAITYTGNSGSQLTGCSARTKDFPSGYPLFQGAQTFPEKDAKYNDYDNQDKVKRVIEKQIDGSAIPTYKQAYNIAEYHGRKSVEGNLKANLKGLMDSLGLTVGDVVGLTHALPGWVDVKFRVTEASESEDEEVDYTLELYDDSFYTESDPLPGVNIATTLPNPFAVPGHVTGVTLSEDGYTNTDGSYVPILTLTYTLPSGDGAIFWDRAKVQVSTDGGANYRDYGYDLSRGTGYKIDAVTGGFKVGDTVTVRVISVSSNNIMADASTAPTASNKIDGQIVAPAAVTGLRIEGSADPNGTTWDGLRFSIVWNPGNQTAGGLTNDQKILGAGLPSDPYWKYDEVEIWISGKPVHVIHTRALRYNYVYGDGEDAFLDALLAAANGAVTIKIRRWNNYNMVSDDRIITITQVAPASPANLTGEGMSRSVLFNWASNAETDFSHYSIRTKIGAGGTWSGWSSIDSNSYMRTFAPSEMTAGTLMVYIEVKAVDFYGNESGASSTNASTWQILPDELYQSQRTDFQISTSIFSFTTASTTLNWTSGTINRNATNYTLASGNLTNAADKYIIATLSGGTATLSLAAMSSGLPTLTADQVIIGWTSAVPNTAGNYICYLRQANSVEFEGAYIRDATITNAKISDLAASKITAGTITSQAISLALTEGAGDVKIQAGKTDFGDTTSGFILGLDDSDGNKVKFEIGDGTKYLKWDGSSLSIRGSLNADDITAGTLTGLTVRTASSGQRVVLDGANNRLAIYNSADSMIGYLDGDVYGCKQSLSATGQGAGALGRYALQIECSPTFNLSTDYKSPASGILITQSTTNTNAYFTSYGIHVRATPNATGQTMYAAVFSLDDSLYTGGAPIVINPSASASAPSHSASTGSLWVTSAGVLYINTSASSPGTTWTKVGAQ